MAPAQPPRPKGFVGKAGGGERGRGKRGFLSNPYAKEIPHPGGMIDGGQMKKKAVWGRDHSPPNSGSGVGKNNKNV